MQALHRHSLRTGAPPRWTPRPLPPLQTTAELSLLARLRQSAAVAHARVASAFRAGEGEGQQTAAVDDDPAPLLDSSLDAIFARMERGNQNTQ
jgi:hypothetical protein